MREVIARALVAFVSQHAENRLLARGGTRIYSDPVLGFAQADDSLFRELRGPQVGLPDHRLPEDWLVGARTVVSYFLPFSEEVRVSNRLPGLPSEEWCRARIGGEEFNVTVRKFLVSFLQSLGGRAVAPPLAPGYLVDYTPGAMRSNWSERHVAYVAGLGTFGLSASLITSRGAAGRLGSVVTDLELEPTPRSDGPYHAHCPWFSRGDCGACLSRCPSGAITEMGKDKDVCWRYIRQVIEPRFRPGSGCGKCQTAVPCEDGIPGHFRHWS